MIKLMKVLMGIMGIIILINGAFIYYKSSIDESHILANSSNNVQDNDLNKLQSFSNQKKDNQTNNFKIKLWIVKGQDAVKSKLKDPDSGRFKDGHL